MEEHEKRPLLHAIRRLRRMAETLDDIAQDIENDQEERVRRLEELEPESGKEAE